MKKEYTTPKVEKMDFDYSKVIVTSGRCFLGGMSVSWDEGGNKGSNSVAGDE